MSDLREEIARLTFARHLERLNACDEALAWVGDRDLDAAWRECQRGDWMLWLAGRVGVNRKLIVLAACDCAEPALAHVPQSDDRPRKAIETARAWCRGEATIQQVRAAAAAAAAAYAAAYAYAAAAADAAAYATAAADAARSASLVRSADLVRARITAADIRAALESQ